MASKSENWAGSALRRSNRRTVSCADTLPDELLLLVFGQLPQLTAELPGRSGTITSRGAAERVCRRWRSLCLATFECTAALHSSPSPGQSSSIRVSALQGIDMALQRRQVVDLQLSGYEPRLLAVLCRTAATAFPLLRRLSLEDKSAPFLVGMLPLCQRLQHLSLQCLRPVSGEKWVELAACIGTLRQLRQLDLEMHVSECDVLAPALQRLPHLTSVSLTDSHPADMPWLPHLRHLSTTVHCPEHAQQLALAVPDLTALTHLSIYDAYSDTTDDGPLTLPELQSLPALQDLRCEFCFPAQVWYCPHLTSLFLYGDPENLVPPPEQLALRCLHRLHLFNYSGPDGDFPPALCQLTQLTSLIWMEAADYISVEEGEKTLPQDFSRLSNLRQLSISHLRLSKASLAPLTALSALTELLLPHCYGKGDCLPRGPYLGKLQVLDISSVDLNGSCPLPTALASAPVLHTVAVDWTAMPTRLADWPGIQAALFRVRRLKVLHVSNYDNSVTLLSASFLGLLALVRDQVCRVVSGEGFHFNRHLCSLASDLQWREANRF